MSEFNGLADRYPPGSGIDLNKPVSIDVASAILSLLKGEKLTKRQKNTLLNGRR